MAQRDNLGGLAIPGVTVVDPALQPHGHTATAIGSQARVSTLSMIGSAPGGPALQVVAAAAMLAGDHARGFGPTANADDIGKPSQAALQMVEHLSQQTTQPDAQADTFEPATNSMGEGI